MDQAEQMNPSPDELTTNDGDAAPTDTADELSALRSRVRELEEHIEQREREQQRAMLECEEFGQYFPDVPLRGVPDEVWGRVREGVPLSAAYALYETRCRREREAEQRAQARTAAMSVGIPDEASRDYFSPAQVRAMSPCEVRENYDRIFESMRHWQ